MGDRLNLLYQLRRCAEGKAAQNDRTGANGSCRGCESANRSSIMPPHQTIRAAGSAPYAIHPNDNRKANRRSVQRGDRGSRSPVCLRHRRWRRHEPLSACRSLLPVADSLRSPVRNRTQRLPDLLLKRGTLNIQRQRQRGVTPVNTGNDAVNTLLKMTVGGLSLSSREQRQQFSHQRRIVIP